MPSRHCWPLLPLQVVLMQPQLPHPALQQLQEGLLLKTGPVRQLLRELLWEQGPPALSPLLLPV
jgi:hypothetical protein